ncbi:MAG: hypothetical protein KDA93_03675 [Planctomycetaceae bacterium]|nr:hypothetical protein [Planctomycetaceae bacterium]
MIFQDNVLELRRRLLARQAGQRCHCTNNVEVSHRTSHHDPFTSVKPRGFMLQNG